MREEDVERVLDLIEQVPPGSWTSYGAIGKAATLSPRHVARILATQPDAAAVPWHRVVGVDARVKPGGHRGEQIERLRSEGLIVNDGVIENAGSSRFDFDMKD